MIDFDKEWRELKRWYPPFGTEYVGKFIYSLAQMMGARRTMEIGVARGYVSIALGVHQRESGGVHIAIDNNLGRIETLRDISIENKLNVSGFCGDSANIMKLEEVAVGGFDIIFVDGDHRMPRCYYDIKNSLSLVKRGGFVIVHDYNSPLPNMVKSSVDALLEDGDLSEFSYMEICGLFVAIKNREIDDN